MSDKLRVLINERTFPDLPVPGRDKKVSGRSVKQLLSLYAETVNHDGRGACMSHQLAADIMQVSRDSAKETQRAAVEGGFLIQVAELETASGGGMLPVWRIIEAKIEPLPVIPNAWQITADSRRVTEAPMGLTQGSQSPPKAGVSVTPQRKSRRGLSHTRGGTGVSQSPHLEKLSSPPKGGSDSLSTGEADASGENPTKKAKGSGGDLFGQPRSRPMAKTARTPKVGEDDEAARFWDELRTSGLLHDKAKRYSKRNHIIAALPPILEVYGYDETMKAVRAYYVAERSNRGGEFASPLQALCTDGRLIEACQDARNGAPKSTLSIDEAVKRLQARNWRATWGERDDPIYDAARDAIEQQVRAA